MPLDPRGSAFWDNERKELGRDYSDLIMRVLISGGTSGVNLLPNELRVLVDWDVFNQHALNWMDIFLGDAMTTRPPFTDNIAWSWAQGLTNTTRKHISTEIDQWVRAGEPLPELTKRLARSAAFTPQRARQTAVTEVTRIYASGNMMAWDASGVVGAKRWRTANDERVCPICGPLHMTIVDFEGSWDFTPEMLANNPELERALNSIKATSFTAPPAHVLCRCWLSPVIIEAHDPEALDEQRFDKQPKYQLAEDRAIANSLNNTGNDILSGIRPPSGRAPRGMGQEYAQRRRIANNIEKHIRWRTTSRQHIMNDRGQASNMRTVTIAKERIRQLDKAIPAMIDIANSGIGDWGFIDELVRGIAGEVSVIRGVVA